MEAKELREKVLKLKGMIKSITSLSSDRDKWSEMFNIIDELALLQPKIEEARRQERERIIRLLETFGINDRSYPAMWQALKGGE